MATAPSPLTASGTRAASGRLRRSLGWLAVLAAQALACAARVPALQLSSATPASLASEAAFRRATAEGSRELAAELPARVVGASARGLIGARLDQPTWSEWRVDGTVRGAPALAGQTLWYGTGEELIALSAETGERQLAIAAPGTALLAAASSERWSALLLGDERGGTWLGVHDPRGRQRLRVTADAPLGAPALFSGALLVPFGAGHLVAIDVEDERELGRVRVGSARLDALWTREGLYFGGPPWIEIGAPGAPAYTLPSRPLPAPAESGDVTRLYVRPWSAVAPPRDIYMATAGRVVLGMERERGALVWVLALAGPALAGAAVRDGLLVCDGSGSVLLLSDSDGRTLEQWRLARRRRGVVGQAPLTGCALSGGHVLRDGEPAPGAAPAGAEDAARPPLLEQLAEVLALPDPALTEAQRFLARELAARPEPEATRVLIDLVSRRSLNRLLQTEAEDLLATRRNGSEHMLAALDADPAAQHASPPPIAALGEALAALGEARAAPLLARQINHPVHTAAEVARAAVALETLASEAEYGELSTFFSLHRTSADEPERANAVVSVGRTLLRIGGERGRASVQLAIRDPLTTTAVRAALERALEESARDAGPPR